ncbi:unnamed protein product, partial [marine sediment metagenome]
ERINPTPNSQKVPIEFEWQGVVLKCLRLKR